MLQGYKTYIVAGAGALVTVLHATGHLDDASYQSLMTLLGCGALGTMAAKINRLNQ